ncbi:hypothetical protein HanPSC8_Chr05g0213171 [Helianthus annuus]|nr:hypothetical protein HanPSC8_Chr05g0213171 [Helianthus annuus]
MQLTDLSSKKASKYENKTQIEDLDAVRSWKSSYLGKMHVNSLTALGME